MTVIDPASKSDKVYFIKQTIPNACGTIALIHAIANYSYSLDFSEKSVIGSFFTTK